MSTALRFSAIIVTSLAIIKIPPRSVCHEGLVLVLHLRETDSLSNLNTKACYIRRLPWEALSSFANQLSRVRTKFNMAGDSNSRKVRAACLLSIFFDKNSAKKLLYIFLTFRLQSYWMKH